MAPRPIHTTIRVHLRRRRRLGLAGLKRYVAGDSPRCGWYPFRISAPAETSGLERLRASPGSFPASYVAFVHDRPRAGRLHLATFWPSIDSRAALLSAASLVSGSVAFMRAAVILAT